jgi:predicted PurR-regulated permease PerM|tara:strand:- start:895 stop:1155 length:261 start_codon:yes stop_codon:yes gene_type:complete
MLIEISLILVSILFIASCYVIWNLNTKLESLEDWITDFINTIQKIQTDIKKIDYKGYFESDDEVGVVFKQIQTTINQLDRFKGEEQ